MSEYELTIVIDPDVNEEARTALVERVKEWIPSAEGAGEYSVTEWGKRKLAYQILKRTEAFYLVIEGQFDSTKLPKLEQNMIYSEEILRYLIIKKEL